MDKNNKKIILIILIALGFLGLFVYSSQITSRDIVINEVIFKNQIASPVSVYDFMSKLRDEGKINFTEKNYIGMGKFIVAINGVKGNGERNWIYYVNGTLAQVGVSDYKIKQGDIVSWKYEKSNY
ncbi:DUF4430 domain-containing protein [Patescibacteria group bacterium]|nr:DUF4430 domain-containing protein [Patescibacteria group bacterium]